MRAAAAVFSVAPDAMIASRCLCLACDGLRRADDEGLANLHGWIGGRDCKEI
jgi:hypothetical protein